MNIPGITLDTYILDFQSLFKVDSIMQDTKLIQYIVKKMNTEKKMDRRERERMKEREREKDNHREKSVFMLGEGKILKLLFE